MPCCDWQTFEDGFLAAWRRKGAGELLIDWKRAKRDWRRHHCTGFEAASMQLRDLSREGEYLWSMPGGPKGEGGGGGRRPINPKPLAPSPVAA